MIACTGVPLGQPTCTDPSPGPLLITAVLRASTGTSPGLGPLRVMAAKVRACTGVPQGLDFPCQKQVSTKYI